MLRTCHMRLQIFARAAARFTIRTFLTLTALTALAFVEGIILWQIGITYKPKGQLSEIGLTHFAPGGRGEWAVSRIYYRHSGINQALHWEVLVHDQQAPQRTLRLKTLDFEPASVSASPIRNWLVVLDRQGVVHVWNRLQLCQAPRRFTHPGPEILRELVCSPDGELLAAIGENVICVWELDTGNLLWQWRHHTGLFDGVCFSQDGTRLVALDYDQWLQTWNIREGNALPRLRITHELLVKVVFSPDSRRAAFLLAGGTLCVVDLGTGRELWQVPSGLSTLAAIAFSPDGTFLAATVPGGRAKSTICLWDAATGRIVSEFGDSDEIMPRFVYSAGGTLFRWELAGIVVCLDPATGRESWRFSARQWASAEHLPR